ncbi:MAG TPA: ribosome maturation factor RimP [Propionibacteriaceae bacterium]|jgi:ribosome maturation factor RimP|nr:ribosome maturation factor RimP [Propionibacteriaceae bacterium]
MRTSQLPGVLTPILAQFDLELEAVEVVPAGKRQLLRVVVDGDGATGTGPLLDDLAEASKALSAALDSSDAVGNTAYTLEVSTRGIGRPLERPAHWRRNRGRLVSVTTSDGATVTGRIVGSDEEAAQLDVDGHPQAVALADVTKALVQVELNRRVEGDSTGEEE